MTKSTNGCVRFLVVCRKRYFLVVACSRECSFMPALLSVPWETV